MIIQLSRRPAGQGEVVNQLFKLQLFGGFFLLLLSSPFFEFEILPFFHSLDASYGTQMGPACLPTIYMIYLP